MSVNDATVAALQGALSGPSDTLVVAPREPALSRCDVMPPRPAPTAFTSDKPITPQLLAVLEEVATSGRSRFEWSQLKPLFGAQLGRRECETRHSLIRLGAAFSACTRERVSHESPTIELLARVPP